MDSWELNKIAGAILASLLAIVLPKTLIELRQESASHSHGAAHVGYTLPSDEPKKATAVGLAALGTATTAAAPTAAAAAPAAGKLYDAVKPLLAAASADAGAATFKGCTACHSANKGGANKVGPALWGVVNRKKGAVDGFAYSATLKDMGGEWSYENLTAFINNPKAYAAGTKMVYAGITDPAKMADLMAYLGTLADSPVPLPK